MPARIMVIPGLLGQPRVLFGAYAAILVLSILLSLVLQSWYLLALPAFFLLVYLTIVDFKLLLFFLYGCIPLSTFVGLPGGFSTDLPTEPLAVGLMLVAVLYFLSARGGWERAFIRHPLTLLMLLHWGWIGVTIITSATPVISVKFWLAKTWYLATFFFLSGWVIRHQKDIRVWFWAILWPLLATVLYVMAGHAQMGFTFSSIERVLHPFYSNHVIYAALLAVFLPFVWYMRQEYRNDRFWNIFLWGSVGLIILAIYLSYTRAAYIAAASSVGVYFLLRWRLLLPAFGLAILVAVISVGKLAERNNYLDLAPNYETTITHEDFSNLIEATYQMEDISTMERLYRWMAAFQMIGERPVVGFGPGSFYESYRPYTISRFRTYVSDNPERSGIHSYYLMVFVEQGLIGLLIFLLLQGAILAHAQRLYRVSSGWDRLVVLMAALCLSSIMVLQMINDLLETDKVGPFYFFSLALLIGVDLKRRVMHFKD